MPSTLNPLAGMQFEIPCEDCNTPRRVSLDADGGFIYICEVTNKEYQGRIVPKDWESIQSMLRSRGQV
jgi:hypothetical protein